MSLSCEICGKSFPTNTSLYIHKQTQHKPPKLLLMNHNHKGKFDNKKRKRKHKNDDSKFNKKKKEDFHIIDEYSDDGQDDENLKIIDDYNDDGQNDSNLDVVDEYNDDGQDDKSLDVIDEYKDNIEDDENLSVIDEYNDDSQDDDKLKIIDKYDRNKKNFNYKKLYEDCLKSSRKLRERIKKIRYLYNKRSKERKIASEKVLRQQKLKFDQEIVTLKNTCSDKINETKEKCEEKIRQLEHNHRKEYDKLEEECEEKIKILKNHIKSIEEDDESVNALTKAIFNCTSMEEIFEIQRLVKNHQIDLVVQRHLKTLQNIFLSLSFGILPICQPQRGKITDEQRKLIDKIQSVSQNRAKGVLKEKRHEFTQLFAIIEDSLKLARNSYNKYGSI